MSAAGCAHQRRKRGAARDVPPAPHTHTHLQWGAHIRGTREGRHTMCPPACPPNPGTHMCSGVCMWRKGGAVCQPGPHALYQSCMPSCYIAAMAHIT
eukprot:8219-Chlamydomonas_euryale.AAC.1